MKHTLAIALALSLNTHAFADGLINTPQPAPPVVQAQIVQQEPAKLTEDQAAETISINPVMMPLSSKLKNRYSAYRITVVSNYPGVLKVVSGNILNATDGTIAYQQVKGSTANSLFGLLLLPIITVPVSAAVIHGGNKKAEGEAVQYTAQVPMIDHIHKGETFQFNALVPAGQRPQVRITFKNDTGFEFVKTAQ